MTNRKNWLVMMLISGFIFTGCIANLFQDELKEKPKKEAETNWNGHRYVLYVENKYGKSWTDARDFCKEKGGHLVTITSLEEQEALYELAQEKGAKNLYWIGASSQSGTDFEWVTWEPWGYTNWRSGEPNNPVGGSENYVQMYRDDGKWNDGENNGDVMEYWSLQNTGFICEWDN